MLLDGYIRVSRVAGRMGESFISPDVQRSQIEQWAKLRGVEIAAWHTDLDQTGGKLSRPGLDAAMARIRAGQTGGIAVAKLDRLSRAGVPEALKLVEEIVEHGGQLAALDLGIDPTTPFGEFALTLMLALARMERRRIADSWKIAQERAVERGVHVSSQTPTGYVRGEDGRLVPHPQFGPVIRTLFEGRAAGASWSELAKVLDEHQVVGPYGDLNWRTRSVTKIIANRVYLGEARSGQFVNRSAHPPLVDPATWAAAQAAKGVTPSRGEPSLLAGILRCAGCRHPLKPDKMTLRDGTRARTYRCRGQHASGVCESRAAVIGRQIEPWVEAKLLDRYASLAAHAQIDDSELRAAEDAVASAEAELAAFRDDERILGALGADRFVEGLQARAAKVDAAYDVLADARAKASPTGIAAASLVEAWPDLTVLEKRKVLSATMDAVFLRRGRALALDDRALVLWHGEGPEDLPRRGVGRAAVRPYVWPAGDRPAGAGVPVGEDA